MGAFSGKGEVSETTIEIKIKTLDSQTYTLRMNKSISVPALKGQIANVTGVLSDRQRLICCGKVLKDDELLSAYHVEDGHTLHLVVRQPIDSTSSSSGINGANSGSTVPEIFLSSSMPTEREDGSRSGVTRRIEVTQRIDEMSLSEILYRLGISHAEFVAMCDVMLRTDEMSLTEILVLIGISPVQFVAICDVMLPTDETSLLEILDIIGIPLLEFYLRASTSWSEILDRFGISPEHLESTSNHAMSPSSENGILGDPERQETLQQDNNQAEGQYSDDVGSRRDPPNDPAAKRQRRE